MSADRARLRIVLVGAGMIPIPPPDYGAVEKHVWNLAKALEAEGHEVRIVNRVFGPDSKDEYRFALWARKEVRKQPYDVLHVHTPGVAAVFSLMGPRDFVFTTHSRHWSTHEGLGERVGFELEKFAVRRARVPIAVSPLVARRALEEGLPKPVVIPNGVDVDKYRPRHDGRNGKRLVGLGEVAPHKRWHVAAEAVKGTAWHLTIVGPFRDPPYATRLQEIAGDQITLTGPVAEDELARILGESDAQVHPSASESFGMAVVEGMSCGLPTVAGDVVAGLVRDGETGFVVPSALADAQQAAAYRRHLDILMADGTLRVRMGQAARDHAVEGYAWNTVAARVAQAYRNASAR